MSATICLVQHKLFDRIKREVALLHKVQQTAGRGYDEHGAATERFDLGYWLTPPKTTANGMPRNLP